MSERVLFSARRHNGDELRVTLGEFSGRPVVQIREWYDAAGEMRPSKKGVSIPVRDLSAVSSALDEARDIIDGKDPASMEDLPI
jgi:hypothetical protein